MNFPLLKQVVTYANEQAAEQGRTIDFSLTTNATLLTPAIIEFLSENRIGVTVSMDGPPELHDKLRVFANGRGSYDIIEPKVRALIAESPHAADHGARHADRGVTDVVAHLPPSEAGSGISRSRLRARDHVAQPALRHQRARAWTACWNSSTRWPTNIWNTRCAARCTVFRTSATRIAELYQGVNKSHPCGAGLGLVGVGPSGDIAPCHRFVDSDTHALGNISTGIDREKQADFLTRGHIDTKYDCHTCWARPLCAGGCHHEAFVRYGDTGHPNLHYCDWIRDWTDTCLRIYGAISAQNPEFLRAVCRKEGTMKHMRALNQKARRIDDAMAVATHEDVVALQRSGNRRSVRTFRWDARWCSRRAGKWIRPAARRVCASRWSAISTTAMSPASGRRRFPIT